MVQSTITQVSGGWLFTGRFSQGYFAAAIKCLMETLLAGMAVLLIRTGGGKGPRYRIASTIFFDMNTYVSARHQAFIANSRFFLFLCSVVLR